jgi:hypothetical protein
MNEIRDKYCYVYLTEEEEAILYKRAKELDTTEDEFIGKAIKLYNDLLTMTALGHKHKPICEKVVMSSVEMGKDEEV